MWDRHDPRENDRDRNDGSERALVGRGSNGDRNSRDQCDPRDVFTRDLDLPNGGERRPVRERERVYEINGAEGRMLSTIYTAWRRPGLTAFRVSPRHSAPFL